VRHQYKVTLRTGGYVLVYANDYYGGDETEFHHFYTTDQYGMVDGTVALFSQEDVELVELTVEAVAR
jgi:hypothetical protein